MGVTAMAVIYEGRYTNCTYKTQRTVSGYLTARLDSMDDLENRRLRLLVFDPQQEAIYQWTP